MTQKKKTDFKIVTPPDDLSEVRAKTKKIHREKLKKIVVPVILIALAVSGTYLMLTNKAYSEAGTAVRYSTDSSVSCFSLLSFKIVCAGDERLLQTHGMCDRQRERKLHFGVALAALARHDVLCTPIRKMRFILRFRDLLG